MNRALAVTFALLSGFLTTAQALGDEPFKPYLDCGHRLTACTTGAKFAFVGAVATRDLIVMLGKHQGKDGFYVFGAEDAYFHELPSVPPMPLADAKMKKVPSLWNLYGFVDRIFHKEEASPDYHLRYKF